ncbi:MAG: glycine betaine ABC transporter substrate-binding protein, partial [Candidatus Eisenbacteria bacterium]
MKPALAIALLLLGVAISSTSYGREPRAVTVGSKAFPESWILGEALTTLARRAGAAEAAHRSNLGGTEIVYQALRSGAIDAYPEYTGTIAEV